MKKSKKWIALFLAALCTFTPLTAFAADVNIDRKPLQMDVSPTVINGRTMVPMRSIFEGLGAAVEWNNYTRGITAQKEDKTITLYLNEKKRLHQRCQPQSGYACRCRKRAYDGACPLCCGKSGLQGVLGQL